MGELFIALLFGLLPVYGSYYLQAGAIDAVPLVPAIIVSILIFLVILINEFPDLSADAAVNKKTLVVWLGIPVCVWIYRIALAISFSLAIAMLFRRLTFVAGLLYLLTLPIALAAIKSANPTDLAKPGYWRASQVTVAMHSIGSIALAAGFALFRFFG
jgi:1,4-dihydroxy-2-naphthoate octaprenyltransferase